MISTQILRYFPHFSGLEEDALGQIASISDKKEFDAGEELFTEGDRASHFCLWRAGQVNIVYRSLATARPLWPIPWAAVRPSVGRRSWSLIASRQAA
jgi:hypothetical protein